MQRLQGVQREEQVVALGAAGRTQHNGVAGMSSNRTSRTGTCQHALTVLAYTARVGEPKIGTCWCPECRTIQYVEVKTSDPPKPNWNEKVYHQFIGSSQDWMLQRVAAGPGECSRCKRWSETESPGKTMKETRFGGRWRRYTNPDRLLCLPCANVEWGSRAAKSKAVTKRDKDLADLYLRAPLQRVAADAGLTINTVRLRPEIRDLRRMERNVKAFLVVVYDGMGTPKAETARRLRLSVTQVRNIVRRGLTNDETAVGEGLLVSAAQHAGSIDGLLPRKVRGASWEGSERRKARVLATALEQVAADPSELLTLIDVFESWIVTGSPNDVGPPAPKLAVVRENAVAA